MLRNTSKIFFLILITAVFLTSCGQKPKDDLPKGEEEVAVFKKITSEHSGITFTNLVEEKYDNFFEFFPYVYNGGGVAIGDINNDGLPDIYFTGNEIPNKLYLNLGDLKFKDITDSAGVDGGGGWHNGVTMVDINHDGWMDIYVCRGGWQDSEEDRRNLLFVNQGNLTFKEEARKYGLDEAGYSMHANFFDFDNDNDLDVYIMNRPDSFYLPLSQSAATKQNPPNHSRDKLYINENGTFKENGWESGITDNYGYGLAIAAADLDKNNLIDLFVANDFADCDYFYVNQGNGTFKEQVKESFNHISLFSMGVDIADINNDGLEDILVMEMRTEDYKRSKVSMPPMDVEGFWKIVDYGMHKQYMHNMLHLNYGNMRFGDISQLAGISQTDWSWSVLASDFNNDGHRDIFVSNGYRRDIFDGDSQQRLGEFALRNKHRFPTPEKFFNEGFKELIEIYRPIKIRNYVFKNKGDFKFKNVSETWGFHDESFSHGAAVADLDGDGDLDLVVNNLENEAFLYENTSSERDNNHLRIKLKGPEKNPQGLGAKITLYRNGVMHYFEMKTVRGYLSSVEPIAHFGLGGSAEVDSIEVRWNDGKQNLLGKTKANQVLEISYTNAQPNRSSANTREKHLFEEATERLIPDAFVHKENKFNEFKEQVLLPHEFAKNGPFVAVGDVNGDGSEDFYVGGASGQPGKLYLRKNGIFEAKSVPSFEEDRKYEDMGVAFFDANGNGYLDLYVVSGGSEFAEGHELYQDRLYVNDGRGNFTKSPLPKTISSGSCVVPFDVDGDGDLDLFVGGQVVYGGYPRAPRSYLLINENGKFVDKTEEIAPELARVGMVNSAVWVDLESDKSPELIVVGEWMPIKIFNYRKGKLSDVSARYGLENTEGWWNRVIAEDLNGDGDIDLVVGNLGENYKFKASAEKPFQVFAADFDNNGTNDIFLAKYNEGNLVPIRGRECTSQQVPLIAQKFPSFQAFAIADLEQIIGKGIEDALHYKAHLFSSVVLINEKGKFAIKKLPVEAQFSTLNAAVADDYDGDGVKDLLIAGNRFDVEIETTPADASPGYLLKGQKDNTFETISPLKSGFLAPYNVKDMQSIKVGEARAVLVSSNDDKLRIFTEKKPKGKIRLAAR